MKPQMHSLPPPSCQIGVTIPEGGLRQENQFTLRFPSYKKNRNIVNSKSEEDQNSVNKDNILTCGRAI